jgi:hypothetical protein
VGGASAAASIGFSGGVVSSGKVESIGIFRRRVNERGLRCKREEKSQRLLSRVQGRHVW